MAAQDTLYLCLKRVVGGLFWRSVFHVWHINRVHGAAGEEHMTQDEIVEMAEQAGVLDSLEYDHMECDAKSLEAFAKLVAEKERERILGIVKEGLWDGVGLRQHLEQGGEA